ncbi:hypothetical protein [Desulforhabdus amnigena]|jgi:hypothetical protein|uniref:Glycosyltransferase family 1 protein n=1 Tax=Desulforhabdus amnigena TaxID=40218 RepID=A0A9W6CZV1_9BACT|nr:hypothetical protein [Desulforhabdus amnigena]NLJ28263.1 hypothetical protein [Deltaproteobacteria bacterium]GLI34816.1 hypothetical protein DAMNIGENAA_22490 [Desulforhabdus amnigena]
MSPAKPCKGKIIVFGIIFWYPLAGVTFQFLHYLMGLRRLGYDPYYVEDSGRWIYNARTFEFSPDASENIAAVAPVLDQYGFKDRWVFRGNYEGGRCYGMSEAQLLQLYKDADAFLNVTASQELREEHMNVPRRIYVESDPFAVQVKVAQGDQPTLDALAAHDTHFSFGENFGAPDCDLPLEGVDWLPTRQPVLLDLWDNPYAPSRDSAFSTITTWHNKGKNIEYRGKTYYWTKDREFLKFLDLPQRRNVPFELALEVDEPTHRLLTKNGWRLVHSLDVSKDIHDYRRYIQQSHGEFTVAKEQVVRPRTGWFSDRSCCYLAAGRPVITQETGFSNILPTGKGLFGFLTMEDILAAVDIIESDYEGSCRAAREIAEEYFAAEKVLASLLERAGLT